VNEDTASGWFRVGMLLLPAVQLPAGALLVQDAGVVPRQEPARSVRGSRRLARELISSAWLYGWLVAYATEAGLRVARSVGEIGSGLNGNHLKLRRLFSNPGVSAIVVEHHERLALWPTFGPASSAERWRSPWQGPGGAPT
jgi:putative resolvase